jgi:hypothetical protein
MMPRLISTPKLDKALAPKCFLMCVAEPASARFRPLRDASIFDLGGRLCLCCVHQGARACKSD